MMELNNLLQFIKNKESYGGNYNIMARDKQETDRALTSKTIKEVLSEQAKNNNRAAGAYQIIPSTMKMLMERMKLTGDEKFDEAMQDKMAIELLRHRGLDKFNTGDLSAEEFGNNLAKEWASLPLLTDIGDKKAGSSYYQGKHGNVALAGADEFSNIVKNISIQPPVADAGVNITQPIGLPDLTNKEDIKRVQKAIGVKADGVWGPKSKEAWTNVNDMFVTDKYRQEGMQRPAPETSSFLRKAVESLIPSAQAAEIGMGYNPATDRPEIGQKFNPATDKPERQYATMEDLLMDKDLMQNPLLLPDDLAQRMWERF